MDEQALRHVRGELEHRPRDPFAVDRERALDAIRETWAEAYDIGADLNGMWWALRRDGKAGVSGCSPDELATAIAADYAARPVVIP